jgi:uroporphyrinogen decarboxylase
MNPTTIQNDRLLKAINKQPIDKFPIWIMRQAGRYLPEYRQIRKQAGSFLNLCKTPELACEVTLQPLARFALDAAILFSDILTIPDALGLGLHFVEGEGPCFSKPVQDAQAIAQLPQIEVRESLAYVADAVRLIKQGLAQKVPLLGFAGSPWTVACYMVEGQASKTFSRIKTFCYRAPELLHQLLSKVTATTIDYLAMQIQAGVDAVMVFDTWGGMLTPQAYQEFSLHYMQNIVQALKADYPQVPIILFTKNGGLWLESIANSGCDVVGVDWTIDMAQVQQRIGGQVALQGNLDPAVLYASPEVIYQHAQQVLQSFGQDTGLIFNLGHGIYPDIPPEHVHALVEAVHSYSIKS